MNFQPCYSITVLSLCGHGRELEPS